jgi:diguanylate cyclase (GGDEF)-like protein
MLDEIGRRTREVAPLFEINIGPTTSFEAILKKANEALVELTLRSQQQATTLQVQNQQLKVQATTDALTGLNNRATFDQFIARQFAASIRENKPLSLILLDVDKFKSINDKHGHPTGDQVLKFVGRLLKAAARQQDLAVRYGGEEMCIVLPATTRAQATTTAETIRRALAAKPVATATQSIPVTASFGVATLEPPFVFKESAQLIKAADLAVYAAKHAGRNCVRVFSPPKAQPKAA